MNTFKIFLAFVIGTGAGLLTGILTAPRSGKKTRKMIVDEVDSTKKSLEDMAHKRLEEAKDLLNRTVEKPMEMGNKTVKKVKEALHVN